MIHYVTVGVALSRPPKVDEWRRYCVVAATRQEAELIAQQIAACTSVMPVESHWESSHRAGPVEPFGAIECTCWEPPWTEDLKVPERHWQIADDCPYHSEDNAAFIAMTGSPPLTKEQWRWIADTGETRFIPPTADRVMEVNDPDFGEHPADLVGKPWIDPVKTFGEAMAPRKVKLNICVCGDLSHDVGTCKPGTGAIVPDGLKRKLNPCTCEQVDVTTYADGDDRVFVRGMTDGDCPLHGDLAQIRAFGHINPGDRLRRNSFGIWSITRYDDMADVVDTYTDPDLTGAAPCNSVSPRPTPWERLRRWILSWGPPI